MKERDGPVWACQLTYLPAPAGLQTSGDQRTRSVPAVGLLGAAEDRGGREV